MFGENTDDARDKTQRDLEAIHQIFKDFILKHRPNIDIAKVATGEYWLAHDALGLGLVDALGTSDDYLLQQYEQANLLLVQYQRKKRFAKRIHDSSSRLLAQLCNKRSNDIPLAM